MSQTLSGNNSTRGAKNRNNSSKRGGARANSWEGWDGRVNQGGRNTNNRLQDLTYLGLIKNRCMKNVVITDSNNRPTQYKNLRDILPIYCIEQKYAMLGDILRKEEGIEAGTFFTAPLDRNRRSQ